LDFVVGDRTRLRLSEQEALDRFLSEPGEESFGGFFRAVAPRVFSYFRARGCEPALAEDLTQEVMIAVFRQIGTLRQNESFRSWLYRVAKNVFLQFLRRKTRQVDTVELDTVAKEPGNRAADPLLPVQFLEWMEFLETDERQIMMLRYIEELEYHEIAEVVEIPLGTVQWKIFHSKKKLAARFGPQSS
jgi:RNA polymerase sigma-70 factor (ECF subfamily)